MAFTIDPALAFHDRVKPRLERALNHFEELACEAKTAKDTGRLMLAIHWVAGDIRNHEAVFDGEFERFPPKNYKPVLMETRVLEFVRRSFVFADPARRSDGGGWGQSILCAVYMDGEMRRNWVRIRNRIGKTVDHFDLGLEEKS